MATRRFSVTVTPSCVECGGLLFPRGDARGSRTPPLGVSCVGSGLEGQSDVLVDVLLGDDGGIEDDAVRYTRRDEVAHRLALSDQSGQRDAVSGLRRRVDDR